MNARDRESDVKTDKIVCQLIENGEVIHESNSLVQATTYKRFLSRLGRSVQVRVRIDDGNEKGSP